MKVSLASLLAVGAIGLAGSATAATLDHYWDMDTLTAGTPDDVAGGAVTTAIDAGGETLLLNQTFGPAYAGAGNALQTNLSGAGSMHLSAAQGDLTNYGQFDWAISYWAYNDATDGDVRGPRVFDSLSTTTNGLQNGTAGAGEFNFRVDDDNGAGSISNTSGVANTYADNAWTHVVINYSSGTDTIEVFFNGASIGSYAGNITGPITHSQDMEIGGINGASAAGAAQSSALDDLAFYTGTLSASEISGLANGTITPLDVPEPGSLALLGLGGLALLRRRRA